VANSGSAVPSTGVVASKIASANRSGTEGLLPAFKPSLHLKPNLLTGLRTADLQLREEAETSESQSNPGTVAPGSDLDPSDGPAPGPNGLPAGFRKNLRVKPAFSAASNGRDSQPHDGESGDPD
jgi:hypothetical protein